MIKNLRKNKKGFTLIEIIVVLVIMGILLAIAVPAILGYVGKANDAKYLAQARGGYLAAQTIAADKAAKGETIVSADVGNPVTQKKNDILKAADLNKELGFTTEDTNTDGYITAATCTISSKYKITSCDIKVKGIASDKYVNFTPEEATIVKGTLTDGAAGQPAA